MKDVLSKFFHLLKERAEYKELRSLLLNNESVSFECFLQKKDYFLKIHEIYLENNNSMEFITPGLEDLINNIKKSEEENIVINIIRDEKSDVTIYTDVLYDTIFGII